MSPLPLQLDFILHKEKAKEPLPIGSALAFIYYDQLHYIFYCHYRVLAAFNACSKSSIISWTSSIPMDNRTISSGTPALVRRSAVS